MRALASKISRDDFEASRDPGDWLGEGVYFWQDDMDLAESWARGRKGYRNEPSPVVLIRSKINLDNCLDLTTSIWMRTIKDLATSFKESLRDYSLRNESETGRHYLDCAFFNYCMRPANKIKGRGSEAASSCWDEESKLHSRR